MRLAGYLTGLAFGLAWGLGIGAFIGGLFGYRVLRRARREEEILDHLDRTTPWKGPQ